MDVSERAAHVATGLDVDVADGARRRKDQTHVVAKALDPLIVSQLRDGSLQLLVLRRQRGRLLERAAHARAGLEDLDLRRDDSGQEDAKERNPHATSDDPVEPVMVREGDDERSDSASEAG